MLVARNAVRLTEWRISSRIDVKMGNWHGQCLQDYEGDIFSPPIDAFQTEAAMNDFVIEKTFLVSYPVFALPQNGRLSTDPPKFTFDDYLSIKVEAGSALVLYTDYDLAQRFMASEEASTGLAVAKLGDCKALLMVLEDAKARGADKVIFDAPFRQAPSGQRCFRIDKVIESAKNGRKNAGK